MTLFFIYLIGINAITFLLNGLDKWRAMRQKQRISEKMLLGLALGGGTLGSGLGMLMFRHKITKTTYLLVFFAILLLQGIVLYLYFNP